MPESGGGRWLIPPLGTLVLDVAKAGDPAEIFHGWELQYVLLGARTGVLASTASGLWCTFNKSDINGPRTKRGDRFR